MVHDELPLLAFKKQKDTALQTALKMLHLKLDPSYKGHLFTWNLVHWNRGPSSRVLALKMENPIGLKVGHFLDLQTLLAISWRAEEFHRKSLMTSNPSADRGDLLHFPLTLSSCMQVSACRRMGTPLISPFSCFLIIAKRQRAKKERQKRSQSCFSCLIGSSSGFT